MHGDAWHDKFMHVAQFHISIGAYTIGKNLKIYATSWKKKLEFYLKYVEELFEYEQKIGNFCSVFCCCQKTMNLGLGLDYCWVSGNSQISEHQW